MNSFYYISFAHLLVVAVVSMPHKSSHETNSEYHQDPRGPIYGGRPAEQDEVPYMLSVGGVLGHFCGAALVEVNGTQVAISGAGCMKLLGPASYHILGGELDMLNKSGYEQRRIPTHIVQHEGFSAETKENDIAIMFMPPFQLNEHVQPIQLPTQGQSLEGDNITVSAWANNVGEAFRNFWLKILEIPVELETTCEETFPDFYANRTENLICGSIEPLNTTITTCRGAGGGPAVSEEGYLAGIVNMCVEYDSVWAQLRESPIVYTKVSQYVDWIYATVENYLKTVN